MVDRQVIRLEPRGPKGAGLSPMYCDPSDFQSEVPRQNLHVYFADPEVGLSVGVWNTTSMQEKFGPYPGDEFIVVLEGQFAMINGAGDSTAARQGDSVCFRNGIPISWKQDGYLSKIYITYLDRDAERPALDSAEGGIIVMDPTLPLERIQTTEPFVIDGPAPVQFNRTVFINDRGNLEIGIWETGPMRSHMLPFPTYEFVQVLEGEVTITGADGEAQTFRPGDCFFVPMGCECSWVIPERLRKYYAILTVG